MSGEHTDLEYHVSAPGRETKIWGIPLLAQRDVFNLLTSHGEATLDVVCWSKAAARAYGGDDAVEQYREDPDASVFERWEFKGNCLGRVP